MARELGVDVTEVNVREALADLGLSSLSAVSLLGEVEDWLGLRLEATVLWEHPTVAALAEYLSQELGSKSKG